MQLRQGLVMEHELGEDAVASLAELRARSNPRWLRRSDRGTLDTSDTAVVLPRGEERAMAMLLLNFEVHDYEAWKPMFDEDPAGRRTSGATNHMISRAVDDPKDVFIRVEFPTAEQAKAFRQRLLDSGALDRAGTRVKTGPVVAEVAETVTY